jgi:hypothetical protein
MISVGISVISLAVAAAAFVRSGRWRAQERQAAERRMEVFANPWFTAGGETGIILARIEVTAQNISTSEIVITSVGLGANNKESVRKIFKQHPFPVNVKPGSPFQFKTYEGDVTEFLEHLSLRAEEIMLSVTVDSGYGSMARVWRSPPFSVVPRPPADGGRWSEWHS